MDDKLQSLEITMDNRLSRIEEQNNQIMLALQKKKKGVFFVSSTFLYLHCGTFITVAAMT